MAADRNGMDDGVDSGPMIKVARAGGGGSVGGRNSKFFGWVLHLFLRAACGVATNVLYVEYAGDDGPAVPQEARRSNREHRP